MPGRRSLIVAIAIVLGVAAGGAAYAELHSAQNRAYNNAKLADVYMVTGPIARGTTGAAAVNAGLIKKTEIPQKFRPATTVTDLGAIGSDVAAGDLPSGVVVVNGLFVAPAVIAGTAAQTIPKGDVAITVSADQVHSVAGLIQPGDKVDILVEMSNGQETFLFQNVPVLAVGSNVAPKGGVSTVATTTGGSNLFTFAVAPDAAARIALAQSGGGGVSGSLYLTLVPPDNPNGSVPTISSSNLLTGDRSVG